MKNKLFVLSADALVREDIAYLETKPNFSRIMAGRAEVTHVKSVYPALTYPAHATLITGCRPGRHGDHADSRTGGCTEACDYSEACTGRR